MQVTITNDLGETVTANDIREAKRIEARMKREEAKRQKAEAAAYGMAKLRADARGMALVSGAFAEGGMPKGYTYYPAGCEYPEAEVKYDDDGECHLSVRLHVAGEYVTIRKKWYYKDTFVGFVANSAGCMAIRVRWSGAETDGFYAVGGNAGVLALTEIPAGCGLTAERFRQSSRS